MVARNRLSHPARRRPAERALTRDLPEFKNPSLRSGGFFIECGLSPLPSMRPNVHIEPMPKAQKPYRTARGTHHGMAERPQRHFETGSPVTAADPRLGRDAGPEARGRLHSLHRLDRFRRGVAAAPRKRPAGIQGRRFRPPPARAAGEIRGRQAVQPRLAFRAEGRPAAGDRRPDEGREGRRAHPGASRRHRLGQDLHHGAGDPADAAPGADSGAQQDARRPALWRVQELLSGQRRRVFRQLLRLLPAGSLRPAHRHLYREGFLHQRADRPHAPLGDACAARARRRDRRRLGVVHLRHRLGRDLFDDDLRVEARRPGLAARADRRSRGAAIPALRRRLPPRHLSRARRRDRTIPGAL